jgi:hypothetical protein
MTGVFGKKKPVVRSWLPAEKPSQEMAEALRRIAQPSSGNAQRAANQIV